MRYEQANPTVGTRELRGFARAPTGEYFPQDDQKGRPARPQPMKAPEA